MVGKADNLRVNRVRSSPDMSMGLRIEYTGKLHPVVGGHISGYRDHESP